MQACTTAQGRVGNEQLFVCLLDMIFEPLLELKLVWRQRGNKSREEACSAGLYSGDIIHLSVTKAHYSKPI